MTVSFAIFELYSWLFPTLPPPWTIIFIPFPRHFFATSLPGAKIWTPSFKN